MSAEPSLMEPERNDPLADPEERRVFFAALDSFRQYRRAAHYNITHVRREAFYSLPSAQLELLSSPPFTLPRTFDAVDTAISHNAEIAEAILETALPCFGVDPDDDASNKQATPADLDKARSTIRQLYRDWSAEGRPERQASYAPVLEALETRFSQVSKAERHTIRVLVPGAGLGRMVFEICAAGYTVEGNEISYHQLLASSFILNFVRRPGQYELYPWALSFSNHRLRSDQLQSVSIPDIHPGVALELASNETPSDVHYSERMSMSSGDFCVLYKQPEYHGAFDAVATCFFIDTAPNVINYIDTIKNCLKPGGIWINLGPLLWHFESVPTPAERAKRNDSQSPTHSSDNTNEGIGEPGSFELSNEEVIALLDKSGFRVVEQGEAPATGYIQDSASMLQNVYRPAFWIAQKSH